MPETNFENLMGYAYRHADKAWEDIGASFQPFKIVSQGVPSSSEGKTIRAWDVWRKVLGRDMQRVIQETGDCVSASGNDVVKVQQCVDILSGDKEEFQPTLQSFAYAYSRVIVGNNQLKGGAGSVGSWMANALTTGGFLSVSVNGAPAYSGKVSDRWGDDKDYNGVTFRQFMPDAKPHTLEKSARVFDWKSLKDAVCNLNFGTIASNRGYTMLPVGGPKGFHKPSGTWYHQLSIMGISDEWIALGNQWGDVHGHLVDLETGEQWPIGMLRVTRSDFERSHFTKNAEVFVFSGVKGFVDNSSLVDGFLF